MARIPIPQLKDEVLVKDALQEIQKTNFSFITPEAKNIQRAIYEKIINFERQSNEERIEQRRDLPNIKEVIDEVKLDSEEERKELNRHFSILEELLKDNSSYLQKYAKEVSYSLINKALGKEDVYTQFQDLLVKGKESILDDLNPLFRGIINFGVTYFKNRSDRKDRVRNEILSKREPNNVPYDDTQSKDTTTYNNDNSTISIEKRNFSDVTNTNPLTLEHIDSNVEELLSYFKDDKGRIKLSEVENFVSEGLGEKLSVDSFADSMRDVLIPELSNMSYSQINELKDALRTEKGDALIEQRVSFEGYDKEEKSVYLESLREMMLETVELIAPKQELMDFESKESTEVFQRESLKEQQRQSDALEKLCKITTGKSSKEEQGGGLLSSLIEEGKDVLLAKMGLDFFKKDKSQIPDTKKSSKISKFKDFFTTGASKAGNIIKKVGGWIPGILGGALMLSTSGGSEDVISDITSDVATEKAADALTDKKPTTPKPKKASIFKRAKDALNVVKNSKAVNFLKEGGSKLFRLGGEKAVQVGRLAVANPALAATVGLAVAAGVATKYANEKAKESEEGQKLLEYGDGLLDTSDNFDFEDAGFEYTNIGEKGLDAFGEVKDEEKYFESVQEKSKEAWNEANKDTEGFRTIASGYKDKKLAWEVWNRGDYDKKYSESKDSDLSTLQKNFAEDYKDAKFLADSGVYFNRDKMAIVAMNSGGEKTFSVESNPELKDVTKSVGMNGMGMPLQIESAKNEYSNAKMSVSNADGNKKQFNVSATTGVKGYEKIKHEFGGRTKQINEKNTVYGDSVLFEDVSELKDAAPMQIKELETEKVGFHNGVLYDFTDGVKDYNPYVGWDAYAPYMFQVESAYLEKDEGLRKTLLDKIKKNFLKTYDKKYKAFSEIQNTKEDVTSKPSVPVLSQGSFEEVVNPTASSNSPSIVQQHTTNESSNKQNETEGVLTQQPSNASKNIDAYTSQPTRTSTPEKKDSSQEKKEQPTVINNFNTTNNNVTQSSPQKQPQIIINPVNPNVYQGNGYGGGAR